MRLPRSALPLGLAASLLVPSIAHAQQLREVDAAVRRGISKGLYPGAVVVIGRRDTVLYARGYGHVTWSAKSRVPDPDSTLWDLASLTKVVATTGAVMRLVDAGLIDLDAPVVRYLPRFAESAAAYSAAAGTTPDSAATRETPDAMAVLDRRRVTVRMLLDHTSGLPAYVPFYRRAHTAAGAIDLLYAEPLVRAPGDSAEYSDLNAMVLGLLIEKVSGRPLDRAAAEEVFRPLRLDRTMFRPPAALRSWVAPSAMYHGRPVREANDQNAVRLGGVAGHAGLFSTGRDLARYAQVWLREGVGPDGPWVTAETIRQFLTPAPHSGTRLLGWDTRDPTTTAADPSVFGNLIGAGAYGHTGWTGTELWIDPARDLFLVLLTNRSFDPRTRRSIEKLKLVRAEVSDAVLRLAPAD
ncbi:MAG TPA: serine hydrolase domain-containing protein [Gemmatimonadales bacterium]|nr:serine hydrolase domain-containing protein [Gemmatimonadales bacterium]